MINLNRIISFELLYSKLCTWIELLVFHKYANKWCWKELLVLDCNTCNHLTVFKQLQYLIVWNKFIKL